MRLAELVATSGAVAATTKRIEKIDRLADLLVRVPATDVPVAVAFLSGTPRQGRVGVGGAALREARDVPASGEPSLNLRDADLAFERMADASGPGSESSRTSELTTLLRRATAAEQRFLVGLLGAGLRQGALEGLLLEAIAKASGVTAARVRRAVMLSGDTGGVAEAVLSGGDRALDRFVLRPFQPLRPMLADSADDVGGALASLGQTAFEFKIDGARIQVHRAGDEVRVYTRALRDVTGAVPEIVEAALRLPAGDLVLDGEAIALQADGRPQPFQVTMRRIGRTQDVGRERRRLPIVPFFFDLLYLDGEALIDQPLSRRADAMAAIVPPDWRVPRLVTADDDLAAAFMEQALAAGHEGLMAKAPGAPYAAGRRGGAWLKIKRARALDLVVLAAEWGHGRRRGWLSNIHLGARDPVGGGFVMLGKTFKGLTDQMLAWLTATLPPMAVAQDEWTVFVRPELVAEVAFNEIQESSQYPGGVTLRFARIKRFRSDKTAAEADTIDMVRALAAADRGAGPRVE